MIAAIKNTHRGGKICVIAWTGRIGLRAVAKTYCNVELNAGDGVLQIHEHKATCEACIEAVKRDAIKRDGQLG
jgi:hypothetical protein